VLREIQMSDKVEELASDVDDALVSVDALAEDPGSIKEKKIAKVKKALETAKDKVDEMEDEED
jgi:outer membrane murein-binding lipoprotein Lpp